MPSHTRSDVPASPAADNAFAAPQGQRELRRRVGFHAVRVAAVACVVVAVCSGVSLYFADVGVKDCADDGDHEVCVERFWWPFTVQLRSERWTEDGVPDGPRLEWHQNGTIWVKGSYDHGARTGPWVEGWPSGNVRFAGTYVDDVLEGDESWFFTDGTLEWSASRVHGKRVGVERWFWPNGNLRREGGWRDGEKHGAFKNFDESGALLFATDYDNGLPQN